MNALTGNAFGIRLRALRDAKGMSVDKLAKAAGVSDDAVRTWESGARKPGFAMLGKLADALGCSVDELVRGSTHTGLRPTMEG